MALYRGICVFDQKINLADPTRGGSPSRCVRSTHRRFRAFSQKIYSKDPSCQCCVPNQVCGVFFEAEPEGGDKRSKQDKLDCSSRDEQTYEAV